MKVITVTTHNERYFPVLKQSCKYNNLDLVVLGFGEKWQGFTWKFKLMIDYLKTIDENEIVIFVDAYDVIALQDANTIEKRFKQYSSYLTKIITGWERAKSPLIEYLSSLIFGKCMNRRINSGCYIGICKNILYILRDLFNKFDLNSNKMEYNDQVLLTKYCNLDNNVFKIDYNYDFFLVINGAIDHLDINKDKIEILTNENGHRELVYKGIFTPCFIHGIGATNMNDIIYKLNYFNINPITLKDTINYDINSILHYNKYLKKYIIYIIISNTIFILIIFIIYLIYNSWNKTLK